MPRLRKQLPKDLRQRWTTDSPEQLIAALEACEPDARDGRDGPVALGMYGCTVEVAAHLLLRGADVDAEDRYRRTPLMVHAGVGNEAMVRLLLDAGADVRHVAAYGELPLHAAAEGGRAATVRMLLARGAEVDARADDGTALELMLRNCRNADIARTADTLAVLVEAGAAVTDAAREAGREIGTAFEFGREGFNPDFLEETDAGLLRLNALLGIDAAPARREHDGVSPIAVDATDWRAAHGELWALLVPASGPASTAQGEAVRITGRIGDEILRNGAGNWDRQYREMARTLPRILRSGDPLAEQDLAAADALVAALPADDGAIGPLCELAVRWVAGNPHPLPLGPVGYDR